jgi:MFS family permease
MSAPAAAVPRSLAHARFRIVALMVGLSTLSYFDRTILSIAGPTIMKEFRISETAMGTVYSAFLLSYTLLMAAGGVLADRFGARMVLTVSGLGLAFFTALTGTCGVPGLGSVLGIVPSFLLVRLFFGACAAPLYPSCARISGQWIPTTAQGRVQALIMAGAAVGSATSPIVFSRLIAAYGWRSSFWLAGAATAALIAAWHASVRDHPSGPAPARSASAPARRWLQLLADKNLLLLTGGYFLVNYFEYIFYYWIYYYFGHVRRLGARESAYATTVLFITMALMTPLGGWVSDRLVARYGLKCGRRSVAIAGMSLSAVLLYFGAGGYGLYATVALLALALGCATSSEGSFWASAIEISGSRVGAACGILNTGGNMGGTLAPVITPLIASRFGWAGGLYFASLLVMLGVLSWFFIDPSRKMAPS